MRAGIIRRIRVRVVASICEVVGCNRCLPAFKHGGCPLVGLVVAREDHALVVAGITDSGAPEDAADTLASSGIFEMGFNFVGVLEVDGRGV